MKRSPRFYFALLFAKATARVMKLIGRKGTSMPGSWAIILCPDFLGRMPRPKTIIGITGTNGKTTVSNLVEDILTQCGYEFTCNRSGSNVATGVASSLIANSTLLGKPKNDLAVFELDERSAPRILPFIKPDLLLCTNIFRDSYKRNAHVEFILDILNTYIPRQHQAGVERRRPAVLQPEAGKPPGFLWHCPPAWRRARAPQHCAGCAFLPPVRRAPGVGLPAVSPHWTGPLPPGAGFPPPRPTTR